MSRNLRYDAVMAKSAPAFEVTCPCCGAVLKVDSVDKAVISHTAPIKPKMFADIEEAAKAMKEQDSRRESIFRQSVEAQKHASDLLDKKFQEALKKAKERETPVSKSLLISSNPQQWSVIKALKYNHDVRHSPPSRSSGRPCVHFHSRE